MKVLVCGGRDFGNLEALKGDRDHPMWAQKEAEYNFILRSLDRLSFNWPRFDQDSYGNWLPDVTIISGKAKGVDSVAIEWAVVNWCPFKEFPADWDKYGKRAGYVRNAQMLEEGRPDLVVAFPGGRGTFMMKRLASEKGIPVVEIDYNAG